MDSSSAIFNPTDHIIPENQHKPVVSIPLEPEAEHIYIRLDGQPSYPNATPEHLQRGLITFNVVIGDLQTDPIHSVQLDLASTTHNPYFTVTDPNPSQSLVSRFRSFMPTLPKLEPEIDMQAVGWGIADNEDDATPIINEWCQLEVDRFPQDPEYVPFDHA
ncbi:hypothetical protein RHGRI_011136 [Rhododendron griersonianum]|uniref:Uncharacterized protein n=1 Tax=Rhododendron griersonianum TaxID=479676 RepID=A0AAV6KLQ2_9ERIC|nr:hypothetical protein RHGRI_011136 [Rhododendron griersonianum]